MSLDVGLHLKMDTGLETIEHEVFEYNITHNLNKMADACGLYDPMWSPYTVSENPTAKDLIPHLEEGLKELKSNPCKYKQYNSPNGWGLYEHLVTFGEKYLNACKTYPAATVFWSK